jgi:flagellin
MRELAVQSANGTYHDDLDREAIQLEVDALKSEIDRISTSTEYNKIKLLDGSLGGGGNTSGVHGPRFASIETAAGVLAGTVVISSIGGVTVSFTTGASGKGGENATWNEQGNTLTIHLSSGVTYTQAQIDDLVKSAVWVGGTPGAVGQTAAIPQVSVRLGTGVAIGEAHTFAATQQGVQARSGTGNLQNFLVGVTGTEGHANQIQFISNNYGLDTRTFIIATSVAPGKEWVENTGPENDPNLKNGTFVIHLSTGKPYTAAEIESIMRRSGLDYTIELTNTNAAPGGFTTFFASSAISGGNPAALSVQMGASAGGQGVGADRVIGTGEGLTFQIGANGVADQRVTLSVQNMGAGALGVANADVSTRDAANAAIETIDQAISKVSFQRAGLGALQNRLESTVNNLTVTQENLTAAESQIRDTDMAKEMIEYTKFSILQQAAQAMLAQANQAPQAILQLLG